VRRFVRRRQAEPLPPPGATPDEAATRPITAVREEEVVAAPGPRPPRIWPWLLALLVLVLAGIAGAYFATRDDDDDDGRGAVATTTVPDVVGLQVTDATRRLVADGFRSQIARAPSDRPRGIVIRQRPAARATLERGRSVTLVVSQGPPRVDVPDVVGLPLAEAFRRVEAAELRPRAKRVFSPRPKGRVFRQQPAAGTELERDKVVSLTVSRGPGRVAVPNVVGIAQSEAVERLEAADLEADVARVPSTETAGTVVAQNPVAGEQITTGSAVRINVSRGSAATTNTRTRTTTTTGTATTGSVANVPDVVGRREAQAVRTLESLGFRPDTYPVASAEPRGTVVSQMPRAGASARRGSTVRVNVSLGTQTRPLATIPEVVGLDEQSARTQLRDAGFAVRTIVQDTTDPAQDGIVLEQQPGAGTQARVGSQVTITVGVVSTP
jgi:eukaryotic-like serine/threonine-protein kinase